MSEIRFSSSRFFFAPGMVDWANNATSRDLGPAARDNAAKLWFLGQMFPTATVETLFQIIYGEFEIDGEDVVIRMPNRQETDDAESI
jgi:hypothetical protein